MGSSGRVCVRYVGLDLVHSKEAVIDGLARHSHDAQTRRSAIAAALLPVKALEAKRGLARSRALAKRGFCKAEHATGRGRDDDLEAAATASRELAADSISAARETPRPPSARRPRRATPRALASPLRCATNETPKVVPGPKPALPPRPKKISPRCVTAFPPAESPPAAKDSLPLVLPGGRKLPPVV